MFVTIVNNYIVSVSVNNGNCKISESEYNELFEIIANKPTAPEGYEHRLRADTLQWELVELPPTPPVDDEATAEDYEAALAELGVR